MAENVQDNMWADIDSHIAELADQRGLEKWEAFRDWAFAEIFQGDAISETISETDLVQQYTRIDGPDDFEIDGYFPSDDDRTIALFQAKYRPRISRNNLDKFLIAPQQVLRSSLVEACNNAESKYLNSLLKEKVMNEGYSLKMVVATSGKLDKRAEITVNDFRKSHRLELEYSDKTLSVPTELTIYDKNKLVELFNRRKAERRPEKPLVNLRLVRHYELDTGGLKTLNALIPAKDLVYAFRKYEYSLFNENPRIWLGTRQRPYIRMGDTLADKQRRARFHLLNNGLSALCDSYGPMKSSDEINPQFEFINFQIVNGCQTTVFLSKNVDKIDDTVFVSLKVTKTNMPELAREIAEATNTQTGLKAQQFKSNDQQQRDLKKEFAQMSPSWFYEIKTGEWSYNTPNKRPFANESKNYRYLSMKDVAQATLAFIGKPGEAFEDTRTIFENKEGPEDPKRHYEDVFPIGITSEQLLLPSLIKSQISLRLKSFDKPLRDPFNYGELHILWLISELLRSKYEPDKNGFLPLKSSRALKQDIYVWFNDLFDVATETLEDQVEHEKQEEEKKGSTFNQRNFYRSRADSPTYTAIRKHLDVVLQRIRRRHGREDPFCHLP